MEDLIECFAKAFSDRDDVKLRLRTEATEKVQAAVEKNQAQDLVEFLEPKPIATAEFAAIYSDVHCTVHPSRGEGFGLIPFQSIACATPVIAPCHSGLTEYINEDNALIVKNLDQTKSEDIYYREGDYWPVDKQDLVDCLKGMEENWEAYQEKINHQSPLLHKEYSWENVLKPFMSHIQKVLLENNES